MKPLTFLLVIILSIQNIISQNIDFEKLMYKEISCYSSKIQIIEDLGKPLKVYNPNYECGFLSTDEQMKDFETLEYQNIKFTGNKEDNFILDVVNFNDESTSITYSKFQLNSETTLDQLNEIFGNNIPNNLKDDSGIIFIPNKNKFKEDGFIFLIKDEKLIKIMYWSPC